MELRSGGRQAASEGAEPADCRATATAAARVLATFAATDVHAPLRPWTRATVGRVLDAWQAQADRRGLIQPQRPITDEDKRDIAVEWQRGEWLQRELADIYGVSRTTIRRITRRYAA